MSDPFVHLRVASGYSLRYGASAPSALVAAAAGHEMDTLAITDRDGLYGAVRFAKACAAAGIAPVVGVDFAVSPSVVARPRSTRAVTPAKGGELRDARLPRVVALATSRTGWASLCRLTTAVHAAGARGEPVCTPGLVGANGSDLLVMLGPDSELGLALAAGRPDVADQVLASWLEVVEPYQLVLAVAHQQLAGTGVGTAAHAGRMLAFADAHRLVGVLTNEVRMAGKHLGPTLDVLDASRRLVPLAAHNVDRRNAEGYLKAGKEMLQLAEEVSRLAGRADAEQLLADTRTVAIRSRLDPRADIGLGEIHLPEFDVLKVSATDAPGELRQRCRAGMSARYPDPGAAVHERLAAELAVIDALGFASYFLTVADITDLVRDLGIRSAARGSGAGSLVNYLLGISGVDPIRHGLLMERFLSPLRAGLPDIDLDVESARRTEVYDLILRTFGNERVACVASFDTYRVRHAVRDVGAALSLPPKEIDAIATAFPHIRAADARAALRDLPELRAAGLGERRLDVLFGLVESLDGLPRHLALHPCGVLLSDATLGDRTPTEASFGGYPMSQFDKDDVEDLGLLKLDVLGIRMQSSIAHALTEIERVEGVRVNLEALAPFDDPDTYDLIARAATLGCFQIESPGQRKLLGKFGPVDFADIIIDISLFRPGPVKSDMVIPFLSTRQGWQRARYLHPSLEPVLAETDGVVVFHEQIIRIIAVVTGCTLAQGDEARRALGTPQGQADVKRWFIPAASRKGYDDATIGRIWFVLESFASFGFCKAHAAAFALPTYQSAWLKTHYPAHFLSGVLTHDPGMYPKRLMLEEARRLGVLVLGLDVNRSDACYRVEKLDGPPPAPGAGLPDGRGYGIRLALADVKGINDNELERIVQARPYASLTDFWRRAGVATPVLEGLVLAGAFDELYGIVDAPMLRRGRITRRDLLLSVADLERADRVDRRGGRARGLRAANDRSAEVQLPLDLAGPADVGDVVPTGLPELTATERLAAELDIIGLDASRHVLSGHLDFLAALGVTFSCDLLTRRSRKDVLIAGVKVATQTPPIRSGRRVVFLTLDDTTGPADATFFEDVQGPYAATVFNSWQLVVRGELRRAGPRGVSVRATGCWELTHLHGLFSQARAEGRSETEAIECVRAAMDVVPDGSGVGDPDGRRPVLVHASGFCQSPYADVKPAGGSVAAAPRKLWHSSPGSAGR